MNIFKATIISLCSALVLLGCGESPSRQAQNATSNNEPSKAVVASSQDQQKDIDYDFPMESYSVVTKLPDYQKFGEQLSIARDTKLTWTDYQIVMLFGTEAAKNELVNTPNDAFKTKAVMDKYLPKIKENIGIYKQKSYLAVPFQTGKSFPDIDFTLNIGDYDFDKKGFYIDWFAGDEVVRLKPFKSKQDVQYLIKVDDEKVAKRIESLKANGALVVQGAVLFHVDGLDSYVTETGLHAVNGMITHIVFRLIDTQAPAKNNVILSAHQVFNKDGAVKMVNERL